MLISLMPAPYYNVSTVNYLAAGSCNFNNSGVSLWPLNQIVADTQYYVRDAVIDYTTYMGTVSPAIEGRLRFITDTAGPLITINAPIAKIYGPINSLTLDFSATDTVSGIKEVEALLDGNPATNGQVVDLTALAQGDHTFTVDAVDNAGNPSSATVTFTLDTVAPVITITAPVAKFYGPADTLTLDFSATDATTLEAHLDGNVVTNGQVIDLTTLSQGNHSFVVKAVDAVGNEATSSVTFAYDSVAPVITISAPTSQAYLHPKFLTLAFSAADAGSGMKTLTASLDGTPVTNGQVIDLYTLSLGNHTLKVKAVDQLGNTRESTRAFSVTATVKSLISSVNRFTLDGQIKHRGITILLDVMLDITQKFLDKGRVNLAKLELNSFIKVVQSQSGKYIAVKAANLLIADARWVLANLK